MLHDTRTISFFLAIAFLCGCSSDDQARKGISPQKALQTFQVADGFSVELVVAEPLIADPVAMEVDANGWIYVVEMHGYPLDTKGSGVVRLLEDTDGDGLPDKSHEFAKGLVLPNGIQCWKNGVIVTDPPHVYYLEDTDGDHIADVREILLTGFSLSNPQHNANSPLFGLDNWIYIAHEGEATPKVYTEQFSDTGSVIRFPANPDTPTLPRNANGRSVRFKPDTWQLEMVSGESQFGQTFSPYGEHINTSNADHLFHEVLAVQYLLRNPNVQVAHTTHDLSDHGNAAEIFPITSKPEHQLLTDVGVITSSCGVTWYGGGMFPDAFADVTFIAEPVHNLVHADRLKPEGASFIASRVYQDSEFLASTDSWFRPVNFYNGPDGALYVIDYYRQIIEHPEWMSDEVAASGALYNGMDKGRIYRITPKGTEKLSWCGQIGLHTASDEELVAHLDHPAVWWRKTAQRLLLHRKPEHAKTLIEKFLGTKPSALGWVHALWLMEGLALTDVQLVAEALAHPEPGVRLNAIRIAELHLQNFPGMADHLLKLRQDTDAKVRFQLLCTIGNLKGDEAMDVRMQILQQDLHDYWTHIAALSGVPGHEVALMKQVVSSIGGETVGGRLFVENAAAVIGRSRREQSVQEGMDMVFAANRQNVWWKGSFLHGLRKGLQGYDGSATLLNGYRAKLLTTFSPSTPPEFRRGAIALLELCSGFLPGEQNTFSSRALNVVMDRNNDLAFREDALRLVSLFPSSENFEAGKKLLSANEPESIQRLVVKLLNTVSGKEAGTYLAGRWNEFSPAVREEVLGNILRDSSATLYFLKLLDRKTISPSTIAWPQAVALMNHWDDRIRFRSRGLLAGASESEEATLKKFALVLNSDGSAASGEEVFHKHCASCHQINQQNGIAFGPDLATIRNRDKRFILLDIVNPDRSIADGFEMWSVTMNTGDTFTGVIAAQTPATITLRLANGKDLILDRQEVAKLWGIQTSAMPGNFGSTISADEMNNLVAFLKSRPPSL